MELETVSYGKSLKLGYTTGSCAAGATRAAVEMLFSGRVIESVSLLTPKGISLNLKINNPYFDLEKASCSITKISGDDPDITNGIEIFSLCQENDNEGIVIRGGEGIGIVTKDGLSIPKGEYAINNVPREMIKNEALAVCRELDKKPNLTITISAPMGKEIAKKTYNEKLGIVGGISILGTSGIVVPMSSEALLKTIELELRQKRQEGKEYIAVCPGNYGEEFIKSKTSIKLSNAVKSSNFIGDTLDLAYKMGFRGVLLIGHIGKLIKLSGGITNTHSQNADCRMELIASNALELTDDVRLLREILSSVTTDRAIEILARENILDETMGLILEKSHKLLKSRYSPQMETGIIMFSQKHSLSWETENAKNLIDSLA